MAINTYFQNIADAIRAKAGTVETITPANMPQAIADIPTGGSTDGIYIGVDAPTNDIGTNGDYYIRYHKSYEYLETVPNQVNNNSMIFSDDWSGDNGQAWHLFDGNTTRYWSTREGYNTNQYCGYDFGSGNAKIISRVGIFPRQWSGVVQIHNFKIQGSNDNSTWVDLYTGEIVNNVDNVKWNFFDFQNQNAYRYYRIFVIDANTSRTITIFEAQFYELSANELLIIDEIYVKKQNIWTLQV